jgi:hypothetical protein
MTRKRWRCFRCLWQLSSTLVDVVPLKVVAVVVVADVGRLRWVRPPRVRSRPWIDVTIVAGQIKIKKKILKTKFDSEMQLLLLSWRDFINFAIKIWTLNFRDEISSLLCMHFMFAFRKQFYNKINKFKILKRKLIFFGKLKQIIN